MYIEFPYNIQRARERESETERQSPWHKVTKKSSPSRTLNVYPSSTPSRDRSSPPSSCIQFDIEPFLLPSPPFSYRLVDITAFRAVKHQSRVPPLATPRPPSTALGFARTSCFQSSRELSIASRVSSLRLLVLSEVASLGLPVPSDCVRDFFTHVPHWTLPHRVYPSESTQ